MVEKRSSSSLQAVTQKTISSNWSKVVSFMYLLYFVRSITLTHKTQAVCKYRKQKYVFFWGRQRKKSSFVQIRFTQILMCEKCFIFALYIS